MLNKIFATFIFLFLISVKVFSQVGFEIGDQAPDFTITDIHGNTHTLSEYTSQGKNVLIDFFAVTCKRCQMAAPKLNEFYHKYGCNQGDVVVLGVDWVYDNSQVVIFENTYPGYNPYPICSGVEGGGAQLAEDYGVIFVPTFCIIGSDGKFKVLNIFPINDYTSFENAFLEAGIQITPMFCDGVSSCNSISNLNTVVNQRYVTLFWDEANSYSPEDTVVYHVFRDDTIINSLLINSFTDENVPDGTYTYCVEASHNNCISEKICIEATVQVVNCNFVENKNYIFPNPVTKTLNINIKDIENVKIYDIHGKIVNKYTNTYEIDVQSFPEGVYIIKILDKKGTFYSQKFIVKR